MSSETDKTMCDGCGEAVGRSWVHGVRELCDDCHRKEEAPTPLIAEKSSRQKTIDSVRSASVFWRLDLQGKPFNECMPRPIASDGDGEKKP